MPPKILSLPVDELCAVLQATPLNSWLSMNLMVKKGWLVSGFFTVNGTFMDGTFLSLGETEKRKKEKIVDEETKKKEKLEKKLEQMAKKRQKLEEKAKVKS